MAKSKKKDNSSFVLKQSMRLYWKRRFNGSPKVLEGFAGEGRLWRSCWSDCEGATIDKSRKAARCAAKERTRWAVYRGDTEAALASGWLGHVAWDTLDLDAYGSPWSFFRAYLLSKRERATTTRVFLTDGLLWNFRRFGTKDSALWPTGNMSSLTDERYINQIEKRLAEWGEAQSLTFGPLEWRHYRTMRLFQLDVHKQ
jgi:hypothetical protein